MKICKRCSTAQPVIEFGKNSRYADGLWLYCKACDRERARMRREANPKAVRAANARSIDKHRDAINTRKRERRAANPEATKAERKRMYAKHRERELTTQQRWKDNNRARMQAQAKAKYWSDPDAARERQMDYRRANPGKSRAWRMGRIAQQMNATPAWADQSAIQALYAVAARVSVCTGIPHEVDHVIPLQGAIGRKRVVSGLHVEYNLRVVPRTANRTKSNQVRAAANS